MRPAASCLGDSWGPGVQHVSTMGDDWWIDIESRMSLKNRMKDGENSLGGRGRSIGLTVSEKHWPTECRFPTV